MAATPVVYPFAALTLPSGAKTVLLITAPANQRIVLTGIRIGCQGQVTTDPPILVAIKVASANGSISSGVSPTFAAAHNLDTSLGETPQSQFAVGPLTGLWSTEPTYTAGKELYYNTVHPQGSLNDELPFSRAIVIGGGKTVGLILTAGASNIVQGCLLGTE